MHELRAKLGRLVALETIQLIKRVSVVCRQHPQMNGRETRIIDDCAHQPFAEPMAAHGWIDVNVGDPGKARGIGHQSGKTDLRPVLRKQAIRH